MPTRFYFEATLTVLCSNGHKLPMTLTDYAFAETRVIAKNHAREIISDIVHEAATTWGSEKLPAPIEKIAVHKIRWLNVTPKSQIDDKSP